MMTYDNLATKQVVYAEVVDVPPQLRTHQGGGVPALDRIQSHLKEGLMQWLMGPPIGPSVFLQYPQRQDSGQSDLLVVSSLLQGHLGGDSDGGPN